MVGLSFLFAYFLLATFCRLVRDTTRTSTGRYATTVISRLRSLASKEVDSIYSALEPKSQSFIRLDLSGIEGSTGQNPFVDPS